MFYYEQMFNTALSGIMSAGLMSTILTVAYGILLASLLFSAYEAWTKVFPQPTVRTRRNP